MSLRLRLGVRNVEYIRTKSLLYERHRVQVREELTET